MHKCFVTIAALITAAGLALTGCSNPSGGGGGDPAPGTVNAFSLDGLITAPVKGATADTTAIDASQYTGTVLWQSSGGTSHNGAFAPDTVYQAVLTLAAKSGWTFNGVAANSFTYNGATSVVNAANSGTVTITFPATAGDGLNQVNAFSLDSLVTAPVRNATPNTTAINETQYSGTIAWQTSGGAAHHDPFAPSTVYRAIVTLTAKEGWTFDGVAANSFAYSGATSVINAANSGTVTITFPATAGEGGDTAVSAFSLDGLVTAPVRGAMPNITAINETQYTGSLEWRTEDNEYHSYGAPFAPDTVYKLMVFLFPKAGWTFNGVGANQFTYTGATSVVNNADSGTVAITFPATAEADPEPDVVSAFSLTGKVTAPVRGATPDTTAIDEAQYTGIIAWQTSGGAAHNDPFVASTVYRAVVTLTAKSGYTFDGVGGNSFTHTGATQISNTANSGIVTITFPATGADESEPAVVNAFSLDSLVAAPVRDTQPNTTAINEAQYTGTIAWQTSGGTDHSGPFAASTVYKAVVALTAKEGWTFDGVAANGFTYTGATVANAANSGTVTITFPATADTVVSALSLDSLVTAPVRNVWPDTDWINDTQYTGTIEWQTENGEAYYYTFADATVYKAVLTLAAKTNYTFDGVAENSFTYTGATSVANAANSGTVTITFPVTEAVVSAFSLDSHVTAPVNRTAPVATPVDTGQYTGSVAWEHEDGTVLTGNFEPFTVYKAVVVLTAKASYIFDGVAENSFTYTGATSVVYDADSGTVAITFPATLGDPNTDIPPPIGNPSVKLYLDGGAAALAHGGTTAIAAGNGTYVVSIDSDQSSIVWYLNGTQLTQHAERTSIVLSKRTAGNYLVTVEATPQGGQRQSGAHTFTVE